MARLAADDPGDMAAAGGILRKHDVAGSKATNRAITGFDFDLTGKCNHVLPVWRRVIIAEVVRARGAKGDAMRWLQL